ncbi:MAG: hypothetical protein LC802_09195 [Acidobacteria bacterium]|nr:hypothetical protein [Acidobacteriota bacterium]
MSVGCGARRTPDLERIFAAARERTGKRPVIVIPGVLGSQIVNRRTGEVVWPSAFRSTVDGLSLPATPDLAANRDELVAGKILETARLARIAPEFYVYHGLLEALRRYGGYREGDWENPPLEGDRDTFYVFAYDWRRDNVESARELVGRVEALKRKLGRADLRFNVVAHSMGGLVARYAAMYGDRNLPPEGAAPRPDWGGASFVNKIFMLGVPNEGSAEAFATLMDGYSVTEGLRRRVRLLNKLSREDALSVPSIFQLLPHGGRARFYDENLQPLSVDLYDPEGRFLTLTRPRPLRAADGRRIPRKEVVRAMYEPGDGRVSRESVLGSNLGGARAAGGFYGTPLHIAYASFACDFHSELHNNLTLQDNALTLLVNEMMN